jgi:hypothetical protein
MEPRNASQPWPSGTTPAPAWTKTIEGAAYTIKRIDGDVFGIWRDGVEELGTFQLQLGAGRELRATFAGDLSLEARGAVHEFIQTYESVPEGAARPEGAAKRDP